MVTVRKNQEEQFFDYSYKKANSKVLYSTRKVKVPSSFKTTIFGQHKIQYERGAFDEQKFSKLFFYLAATFDRKEKINKYLTSVHLKPFHVDSAVFGKKFSPADPNFDRAAVVSYMRKVAQQSSQNLKRNADAFYLLSITTMKTCFGQEVKEHLAINLPFPFRLFLFKLLKNGKNSKNRANISRILY